MHMRAKEFIIEYITRQELTVLKRNMVRLYSQIGIDLQFSNHFLERCNDPRNEKEISIGEVTRLFREEFKTYGKQITQLGPDAQAVFKDLGTQLNVPFVLIWDRQNQILDLVAKSIMRKQNYLTSNPELPIR